MLASRGSTPAAIQLLLFRVRSYMAPMIYLHVYIVQQIKPHRFAELAGDAAFFSTGIPSKNMLSAETWAQLTLFERIVDLRPRQHVSTQGMWCYSGRSYAPYGSGNSAVVEQSFFTHDKRLRTLEWPVSQDMLTVTLGSKNDLSV